MIATLDAPGHATLFTRQDPASYTEEDHEVWTLLYDRRMDELSRTGSSAFLAGVERIGIRSGSVPQLAEVNRRLAALTGWSAVAVHGFIPARLFFGCLAERRFPTTVRVQPRSNLDYLPGDPDIFHDVFGHVPMHADAQFADFLQRFGQIAGSVRSEEGLQQLARLFWFTVEFGLIREGGDTKLYGSGLMSSHGEAAHALGPGCERRPFMLDAVLSEPVPVSADEINTYHPALFVIESFEQVRAAMEELSRVLR